MAGFVKPLFAFLLWKWHTCRVLREGAENPDCCSVSLLSCSVPNSVFLAEFILIQLHGASHVLKNLSSSVWCKLDPKTWRTKSCAFTALFPGPFHALCPCSLTWSKTFWGSASLFCRLPALLRKGRALQAEHLAHSFQGYLCSADSKQEIKTLHDDDTLSATDGSH